MTSRRACRPPSIISLLWTLIEGTLIQYCHPDLSPWSEVSLRARHRICIAKVWQIKTSDHLQLGAINQQLPMALTRTQAALNILPALFNHLHFVIMKDTMYKCVKMMDDFHFSPSICNSHSTYLDFKPSSAINCTAWNSSNALYTLSIHWFESSHVVDTINSEQLGLRGRFAEATTCKHLLHYSYVQCLCYRSGFRSG